MIGYIYLTTNTVNNKKYIGRKCSDKFLGTKYLGSGTHLKQAIKKYGKESFTVELLEEVNTTYEDLIALETYYIILYDAVVSPDYYNQTYGGPKEGFVSGDGNIAKLPEIRQINSEAHKGKKHSVEQNQQMSNYWKTHGHPRGFLGHHHTTEAREKNRLATTQWNLSRDEESYKQVSNHHTGSKMMYKDGVQKWVYRDDIENHLQDEWKIGSCKKRKPKRKTNKVQ